MSIKGTSGSKELTADVIVGLSGKPVRVWNVTWLSGGTAGDMVLRNGATDSGTAYTTTAGIINKTSTLNFEGGLRFTNGCFYDHDSNTTSAVIEFETEV